MTLTHYMLVFSFFLKSIVIVASLLKDKINIKILLPRWRYSDKLVIFIPNIICNATLNPLIYVIVRHRPCQFYRWMFISIKKLRVHFEQLSKNHLQTVESILIKPCLGYYCLIILWLKQCSSQAHCLSLPQSNLLHLFL